MNNSAFEFGVIGLGPAGCFFLACLPEEKWASTVAFDSGCFGGDLARLYGNVTANLTCAELGRAFRAIPRWATAPLIVFEEKYAAAPDVCPLLADVAQQLRELMKPVLARVTLHSQHVVSANQGIEGWRIVGNRGFECSVAKLAVCTGGEPKGLDYPRPSIPLEIALDTVALRTHVKASDKVVVFGTAHSGTLILRNLRDAGCHSVTAVYREAPPFRWARKHTTECPCHLLGGTGCHDSEGVKQESAAIADAIVRGDWGSSETPTLLPLSDTESLVRAIMAADYLVYAVGFTSRLPMFYGLGGGVLKMRHDPVTAQIAPGLWGFGIAFPSQYHKPQGGQAIDIGLPAFASHIQQCIPAMLL